MTLPDQLVVYTEDTFPLHSVCSHLSPLSMDTGSKFRFNAMVTTSKIQFVLLGSDIHQKGKYVMDSK